MHARVVSLVLCVSAALTLGQREPTSDDGTTPNIKEVFVGRCWDYDVTKYKGLLPRVEADCGYLWRSFEAGFSYQPPCAVSTKGYSTYLDVAKQKLPKDKVMFWSGVFVLAHRLSHGAQNYVTLEDTLIGYLANSLIWCGQSTEPGMNYTRCPEWDDCPLEASESFWAGASTEFAKQASGNVTLIVGGSDPDKPAYRPDSFFGKHELPNLSKSVTAVNVLVAHALDKPVLETCDTGSLIDLREDVKKRGLEYHCENDPEAVMHLLCSDDPSAEECKLVYARLSGQLGTTGQSLTTPQSHRPARINAAPVDRFNSRATDFTGKNGDKLKNFKSRTPLI